MNNIDRVAVCSRSFSQNLKLRSELQELYQNVRFNESGTSLQGPELIKFISDHDKVIVGLEQIDDGILSQLPELRVISKYGVGLDKLDLTAMRRHKVKLGWFGGVNSQSVAELALGAIIGALRNLSISNFQLRNGIWEPRVGNDLFGKAVGIIGCGNVGKTLVKLLQPFNCTLLANDISYDLEFCSKYGVVPADLDQVLRQSDIVSLHLPLTEKTKNILNAERLKKMKKDSILVNTARGGLVDEKELKEMLVNQEIRGAAFDVFEIEPPQDYRIFSLPNFSASPHLGGSSEEAILAMGRAAINGLKINAIP